MATSSKSNPFVENKTVKRYDSLLNEEDNESSVGMDTFSNDEQPVQVDVQQDMQPSGENAQQNWCHRQAAKIFSIFLKFILGVWEPTHGCKQWICRILLSWVPIAMLVLSTGTVVLYLVCFFGRANHLLLLLSFVSYWLSVMSPQIICTIAIIWNVWIQFFPNDIIKEDVHGEHIFHLEYISKHFQVKFKMLVIYVIFGPVLIFMKSKLTIKIPEECKNWHDIMSMVNEALSIVFYTLFCYFLYLQRIALEKEGYDCFEYIRKNSNKLNDCKMNVVTFFKGYKRLRKVLIPWIWIVLFCSSFGMTAVFTWNYDSVPQSTLRPPMTQSEPSWCDHVTCDQIPFLIANDEGRRLLNINVLYRNIMTAGFALHVVYGSDLKHIWDTFRLRLFTIISDENKTELQEILQFMDCMYPESSANSLGIIFSIAGILTGILGSDNFK